MKRTLIALAMLATASNANAMTYSYFPFGSELVVTADGIIQSNEFELFNNWMSSLPPDVRNIPVAGILFNSPGGDPVATTPFAEAIRTAHWDTGVYGGGICASACVLIWAAGERKFVAHDGFVGVHRSTTVSAKLVDEIKPSPDSVYWLTPADLAAWHVKIN